MTIYQPPDWTPGDQGKQIELHPKLAVAFELIAAAHDAYKANALTLGEYQQFVNEARDMLGLGPIDIVARSRP